MTESNGTRLAVVTGASSGIGAATARAVARIAAQRAVEMPISTLIAGLAEGRIDVKQAMDLLMARPLKEE